MVFPCSGKLKDHRTMIGQVETALAVPGIPRLGEKRMDRNAGGSDAVRRNTPGSKIGP
jgi:hypothetical protein